MEPTYPPTPDQMRDAMLGDLAPANPVQERIADHVVDSLTSEGLEALLGMLTRLKIREYDRGFDRGRNAAEAGISNLRIAEDILLLEQAHKIVACDVDDDFIRQHLRAYAKDARDTLARVLDAVESGDDQ